MKSIRTREFRERFRKLPSQIQSHARERFHLFLKNPRHRSFLVKRVRATEKSAHPELEYRVDQDYRATCYIDGETYVWVFIGSHSDFDQRYR